MASHASRGSARTASLCRTLGALAATVVLGAAGCGGDDESDAGREGADSGAADSGVAGSDGEDAGREHDGSVACARGDCTLDCDPMESTVALLAATASDPAIWAVGDPEPVPPEQIGDGRHHLFVGAFHEGQGDADCSPEGKPFGNAFVHDAVADAPEGPYSITAEPILSLSELDDYDRCGIETPSYLRVDERTEYLYYCGLSTPSTGNLAALRRVDGGDWEKVGVVAPQLPGQTSQCEPDVVRDPSTGLFHLFYMSDFEADKDRRFGLFVRTSEQPDRFDPASETILQEYGPDGGLTRPSLSYDPFDHVWRFGFDAAGYVQPPVRVLVQTWAVSLFPGLWVWNDHGGVLHDPAHDLHPGQHLEGIGNILAQSSAVYPDSERVLFFYTGKVPEWQINVQVCRRR